MRIVRAMTEKGEICYCEQRQGNYYRIWGDICRQFDVREQVAIKYLLPPVAPSKVVAVGVNYASHREEMHHDPDMKPVLFLKPPSAVITENQPIIYPKCASTVHYEAELAVIISARCKDVKACDASRYILGYTCANDVSERNLQKLDGQWTRAKGFDTFCPLGSAIVTDVDVSAVQVETYLNGVLVQSGNTRDLICNCNQIIEYVSSVMTLEPLDVILTGTPKGVGEIKPGDTVEIRIEKVGSLTNKVVAQ